MAPQDEDKFGNEAVPTTADGITIGNGYLNVSFVERLPFTTSVSLVCPQQTDAPEFVMGEDGYYDLELRCNTQIDVETPGSYSMVSYSLSALSFPAGFRGISLKVNLAGGGEKELVYTLVQEGEY